MYTVTVHQASNGSWVSISWFRFSFDVLISISIARLISHWAVSAVLQSAAEMLFVDAVVMILQNKNTDWGGPCRKFEIQIQMQMKIKHEYETKIDDGAAEAVASAAAFLFPIVLLVV